MKAIPMLRFIAITALSLSSAFVPASASAGLLGDSATAVLNNPSGAFSSLNNFTSPQTVGAGSEFTGQGTDVFGQIWDITLDVADNAFTVSWTEQTRAGEPNGGNISCGSNCLGLDLSFASSILPSVAFNAFSSSGNYSPLTPSYVALSLTGPNSLHVEFSRMDSTDSYTFSTSVPEPATLALMGLGLAGLSAARRRCQMA